MRAFVIRQLSHSTLVHIDWCIDICMCDHLLCKRCSGNATPNTENHNWRKESLPQPQPYDLQGTPTMLEHIFINIPVRNYWTCFFFSPHSPSVRPCLSHASHPHTIVSYMQITMWPHSLTHSCHITVACRDTNTSIYPLCEKLNCF